MEKAPGAVQIADDVHILAQGDEENRAIAEFTQAISLDDPNFARAFYAEKRNQTHALADFDRAIQLAPDFAPAYYMPVETEDQRSRPSLRLN